MKALVTFRPKRSFDVLSNIDYLRLEVDGADLNDLFQRIKELERTYKMMATEIESRLDAK